MKFTCDSCSAQYMIADEKIGARGVKVRCKKCSHVIVLKPASVPAPPAEGRASSAPSMPFSLSPDAPSATASAFELPNTSSEMGLSAEFSAAGFDDTQSSVVRPSQTNLRDELVGSGDGPWGDDPGPVPGGPSPFALATAGGSLSDFTDEAPNTELSAFPEFGNAGLRQDLRDRDEDPGQTTKVDSGAEAVASAFGLAAPRSDSTDGGLEAETRVAPVDIPPDAIPGFGDDPTSEGSEDEVGARASAPAQAPASAELALPSFDFGRSLADALGTDEPTETPAPALRAASAPPPSDAPSRESAPAPWGPPGLSALASEAAQEGNDLGAALGDALGAGAAGGWTPEDGLGDLDVGDFDIGGRAAARTRAQLSSKPPSVPAEAPVQHLESTAVGVTMAEAEGGEQAAMIASQMAGLSKEHLDAELGSALDAVFGDEGAPNPQPSSTGPDPFASLVASAKGALVSTGIAPEEDRKETRVFDNEAMLRVQEEQHRAFGVGAPEPEAVKEWYVGIDDEQVGPMTVRDMERHWDDARIDANALCWRQGMGDWTAIRFVEEFAHLLERPQTKKPKAGEKVVPLAAAAPERSAEPLAARTFSALGGGGMAAQTGSADAGDLSDWRPSAASALASLAAAELDAPKANDIQVGPVLPVKKGAGGAFESLIEPPTRSASLFGVQEETSPSMSSAITRAPELVSPVPIAPVRARSSMPPWLPPTIAVLVGFALLGGVLVWKLSPGSSTSAPSAAERPVEIAQAGLPAVAPSEPAAVAPAEAAPPPAAAPSEPTPPPVPTTEALAAAAPRDEVEDDGTSRGDKRRAKKERSGEGSGSKKKSKREREVEDEPPPPPPPPTRAKSTADDLLESAGGSRRSAPEAPVRDTLDESDIFRVLKNNRSAILSCVDAQRKADPSVEGVMTVKFVIQGSGKTSGHAVEPSKFGGTKVGKCVIDTVKKWSFPTFSGRAIPLDFPVKVTGG